MHIDIISGKGGVGKSAVAAALARLHARRGDRVLAIAMVPGGGLGSHLGLRELTFDPQLGVDGVRALELDKAAALEQYVHIYSPIPLVAEVGRMVRIFDVLAEAAPGVREIVTIGKVAYEAWEGPWDRIVVDAVPTGQLASQLQAPDTIAELIPTGRVREQAARIRSELTENSSVTLVTLAEELPVTETLEGFDELEGLPPTRTPIIANRLVGPPPPATDDSSAAAAKALAFHADIATGQAHWLAELPDGPRLPYLFGTDDPLLVSEFLGTVLADHR